MASPLNIIQGLFTAQDRQSLRQILITQSTGSFGLNIASIAITFGTTVIFTRILGYTEYGVYSYIMSWVLLLQLPALLGQDHLLVRNFAAHYVKAEWEAAKGLLVWSSRLIALASILLVVTVLLFLLLNRSLGNLRVPLALGILSLPFMVLTLHIQAIMRGLRLIVSGRIPELLIRPIVLILIVISIAWLLQVPLKASYILLANLAAALVTCVVGIIILMKALPASVKSATSAKPLPQWRTGLLIMLLISTMQTAGARLDILLLGSLLGTDLAGVYNVALRSVHFVVFPLIATNGILGPVMVGLHSSSQSERLQSIITRSAQGIFLVSLPIALGFYFFGDLFLALFGPEFTTGHPALKILSLSRLVEAFAGIAGTLLIMTGFEREYAVSMAASLGLNFLLDLILIPHHGLVGAAISSATAVILLQTCLVFWARNRLGIRATPLGNLTLYRAVS